LKSSGKDIEIDLEMVGGKGKEGKVLNLIEYAERRNCLPSLLTAVRQARPGISI
jgi:effector-associated domain 7 (EAD7)-containing protein